MEVEKNSPRINLEKMYESYRKSGGGQTFEAFCKTQLKHSVGYQAAVASPPYADGCAHTGGDDSNPEHIQAVCFLVLALPAQLASRHTAKPEILVRRSSR